MKVSSFFKAVLLIAVLTFTVTPNSVEAKEVSYTNAQGCKVTDHYDTYLFGLISIYSHSTTDCSGVGPAGGFVSEDPV